MRVRLTWTSASESPDTRSNAVTSNGLSLDCQGHEVLSLCPPKPIPMLRMRLDSLSLRPSQRRKTIANVTRHQPAGLKACGWGQKVRLLPRSTLATLNNGKAAHWYHQELASSPLSVQARSQVRRGLQAKQSDSRRFLPLSRLIFLKIVKDRNNHFDFPF